MPRVGIWVLCFLLGLLACSAGAAERARTRPNILIAVADDWSYGHASAYGCKWIDTPGFDQVARAGLLFRRAYTPNAKCAPSRACIITGRNSWQLKDACNHVCFFPPEFKSFGEALSDQGYSVGYTGKGWGPGVAKDENGVLRQLTGRGYHRRKLAPPAKAISNNDYAGNFAEFLSDVPDGDPWCFWFGTLEPHRGYEYGVGTRKGGRQLGDIERVPGYWPDNETVRQDMLDYGFEVEHFDHHLVRILEQLRQSNQLDNTLVIVTSDHGMPFPRCKGQAYEASNHVPLAIMWEGNIVEPGRTVQQYVSFVDFAPTVLEAAGLSAAEADMQPVAGESLFDVFRNEPGERAYVVIGKERHDIGRPNDWGFPIRGILKDDMLYIRNYETERWPAGNPETGYLNCDGSPTKTLILDRRRDRSSPTYWQLCFGKRRSEELYNVADDPDCLQNLANEAQFAVTKQALIRQMHAALTEQQDPRVLGNGEYFDNIRYAGDNVRNFHERYLAGEKVRAGWVNRSDFETDPVE